MATLRPRPVPASRLTWVSEERRFVGELSDLGGPLGRVFDDACDVGLTLIGETGREIVFYTDHEEYDPREGELLWIDLVAVRSGERSIASVRLYND